MLRNKCKMCAWHAHMHTNCSYTQKETVSLSTYRHHNTHTHTRLTALFPGLPGWAGTRKVKPIWILLKQRDSEWQWHQLGHMQACISLQTGNHASTPVLSFLQAGCPSCRPTNSVKALKALSWYIIISIFNMYTVHHVCTRTESSQMCVLGSHAGYSRIH